MFSNALQKSFQETLISSKLVILVAPYRAGRSIFLEAISANENTKKYSLLNKKESKALLEKDFFAQNQGNLIIIEEAQLIKDFSNYIENFLGLENTPQLVCICSSSPILDELLKEALEINGNILHLNTPTYKELTQQFGLLDLENKMEARLIFGAYPVLFQQEENAIDFIKETLDEQLVRAFPKDKRVNKLYHIKKVLQYCAFNLGQTLSHNEIAKKTDLDNETVQRYLELLEDAGIIFKLDSWFNEKRYELKKGFKVYFFDNGIRNVLINQVQDFTNRFDQDVLWENWIMAEVKKKTMRSKEQIYFWQSTTNQHINLILQKQNMEAQAFVIHFEKNKKIKTSKLFKSYYNDIPVKSCHVASYWTLLS